MNMLLSVIVTSNFVDKKTEISGIFISLKAKQLCLLIFILPLIEKNPFYEWLHNLKNKLKKNLII